MIRCTDCGANQYDGTLFCSECGNFLYVADPNTTAVLPFSDFAHRPPPPALDLPELEPELAPQTITFFIPGSRRHLTLELKGEIRIGRADPRAELIPELDLTSDDGAGKGVSRLHAAIRAYKQGIVLIDLGSTNGTLLNTYRLPAERPYPIKSGDEIRFGELLVHLFLE